MGNIRHHAIKVSQICNNVKSYQNSSFPTPTCNSSESNNKKCGFFYKRKQEQTRLHDIYQANAHNLKDGKGITKSYVLST